MHVSGSQHEQAPLALKSTFRPGSGELRSLYRDGQRRELELLTELQPSKNDPTGETRVGQQMFLSPDNRLISRWHFKDFHF